VDPAAPGVVGGLRSDDKGMTPERHRSYLAAKRFLKSLAALDQDERVLLIDLAEGLLLTRPGREDDADELLVSGELALNQLTLLRRIDIDRADDLRTHLLACGPARRGSQRFIARTEPGSGPGAQPAQRLPR
jgi:hypothetical protein